MIKINFKNLGLKKSNILDLVVVVALLAVGFGGWALAGLQNNSAAAAPGNNFIAGPMRLHVIANSDNSSDQALKLMVRDAVVEYLTPKLAGVIDSQEAEKIINQSLPDLTAIASSIAQPAGYGAESKIGIFAFPAKKYGKVEMVAGNYKALKIILGEGQGQNWWCVLFPPLCFVDEAGELKPTKNSNLIHHTSLDGNFDLRTQAKLEVKLKINDIFYIKK